MREILLKGKRLDNGEWVEGFYLRLHDYKGRESIRIYSGCAEIDCGVFYPEKFEVDPDTVGQFTGLVDKHGKRIFEGDVLKIAKVADDFGGYYSPPIEYPVNVVVKWDFCAWMWETLCSDKRYIHFPNAWCKYECEVVGNIHDNPELLKEGESDA